jgi:hypothetical protein
VRSCAEKRETGRIEIISACFSEDFYYTNESGAADNNAAPDTTAKFSDQAQCFFD